MYRKQAFSLGLLLCLCVVLIISQTTQPDALAAPLQPDEAEIDSYVFRRSWGAEGDDIRPAGLHVGEDGIIYVANWALNRITQINPDDGTFTNWLDHGDGTVYTWPSDIVQADNGNFFIVDSARHRIVQLDSNAKYLRRWGSYGVGDGQFSNPKGIAIDSKGIIYVTDTYNQRIQRFDSKGQYLGQWGEEGSSPGQFDHPGGIAIDSEDNIFIADSYNDRIQKFSSDGVILKAWGTEGISPGEFNSPWDIAVDSDDYVYVADSKNNRIQKFTKAGAFVSAWMTAGGPSDRLQSPNSITIDKDGDVYVGDSGNFRIVKYSNQGAFLTSWGNMLNIHLRSPYDISIDNKGRLFVADEGNHRIVVFNQSGVLLNEWGEEGYGSGQFRAPRGIAIDRNNNVFVTDSWNNRIQVFNDEGEYIREWGSGGSGENQFHSPYGIAVDKQDRVYVADAWNHRVQVFSIYGDYIEEFGSEGSDSGEFNWPWGIAIDSQDNIFVAEAWGNRIQKFNKNWDLITEWPVGALGIDVDEHDNVFAAGGGYDKIYKFDNQGNLVASWGGSGSSEGQLRQPLGLAVANDYVFVAEVSNERIQVFSSNHPEPDPVSGLLLNGSFDSENPLNEWSFGGELPLSVSAVKRVHGQNSLQLGSFVDKQEQGKGMAWAHQTIYVDPAWVRPTLSFRYSMYVNDILHFSDFFVAIQDGVGINHLGIVLRDGYQPCIPRVPPKPGTDLGWRTVSYDLSPFKGQHIRIVFSNRNLWPQAWGIWAYVDDVRVVDAGPVMPLNGPYFGYLPTIQNQSCDPVPAYKSDQAMIERLLAP